MSIYTFNQDFWVSKVNFWMDGEYIVAEASLSHPEQISKLRIQRVNHWPSSTRPDTLMFWWWDLKKRCDWLIEDVVCVMADWYDRGWRDDID